MGRTLRALLGTVLVGGAVLTPLVADVSVAGAAPAVTLYVQSGATGATCTSTTPCGSVAEAVTVAQHGDAADAITITVGSGVFLTRNIDIGHRTATLDIVGAGPLHTFLDGTSIALIFTLLDASNVTISGVTIAQGAKLGTAAVGAGGGVRIEESTAVTIENDRFTNDIAHTYGGDLYIQSSTDVAVDHDAFSASHASTDGGCVTVTTSVTDTTAPAVTLTSDTFSTCSSSAGGAVSVYGSQFTLSNSTFATDSATTGGALLMFAALGSLSDNTFTADHATTGGAVYDTEHSTLVLTGATFSTDHATTGGAVFNETGSHFTVTDATFSTDHATTTGGAVDNRPGSHVTVTDAAFSTDDATTTGGAVDNTKASAAFTQVTFRTDGARWGGAVYNAGSPTNIASLEVTRSTFAGDHAPTEAGGAIVNDSDATASVTNTTFAGNAAEYGAAYYGTDSARGTFSFDTFGPETSPYGGGAIGLTGPGTRVTVADSIFSGATCSGPPGTFTDDGHNVETGDSCDFGATSTNTSTTIGLEPLAANGSTGPETMAIGATSSAFEEVPSAACSVHVDERGDARPGASGQTQCDAGAYELQVSPVTAGSSETPNTPPSPSTTPPKGAASTILRGTIKGDVHVKPHSSDFLDGGTVTGTVYVPATSTFAANGGKIGGSVTSLGGPVSLIGTHVSGNVTVGAASGSSPAIRRGAFTHVCRATIGGDLTLKGVDSDADLGGSHGCPGNAVGGNLTVLDSLGAVSIQGNHVAHDIDVAANAGGVLVANKAGGTCTLGKNRPRIDGRSNGATGTNTCNATR